MMPQPPGSGWQQPRAAKPGVIPLRPLALGEILDGAFSVIRAYPRLMLGASAIVVAVIELATLVMQWTTRDAFTVIYDENIAPEQALAATVPIFASAGIVIILTLLAPVFLSGFLTVVVGKAVLGQTISFGEAWAQIRPRLLPLFGLTVLYGLIVIAGTVLLIIPGIWMAVLFGLATPALVLEPAPIGRALSRSSGLVRGSWWRVFGILVLAGIIAGVVSTIIQLPFSLFGGGSSSLLATGSAMPTTTSLVLTAIGATIAGTITTPFSAGVNVLLYLDQRMRREGLDIELARAAGVAAPAPGYPGGPPQY